MKIVEPHGVEPTNAGMRKRRLEALLSAWRMPRAAYLAEFGTPPDSTGLTPAEWPRWLAVLRAATPVSPRNHLPGLETYSRLAGVRVDELVRDKAILILGDQVALRMRQSGLGPTGHAWSILVPAQIAGQPDGAVEAVLRKRFREVQPHGDAILASGSWHNCTDSVSALVADAVAETAPASLRRLWTLSLALDLEYRFLSDLPAVPAGALAQLLGEELLAAADRLDVITDARLSLFAAGQEDALAPTAVIQLRMPESRLAGLLEAARFLDHSHNELTTPYYESLASAHARIADVYAVGEVLQRLPPGRALLAAIDAICLDRPELVATYVRHEAFHAEGALALLRLPQRIHLPQAHQLDLTGEWLEVQRLGRELLLLADCTKEWSSLVALGIHDEADAIARKHHGIWPNLLQRTPYEGSPLWTAVLSDPERSEHHAGVLDAYFRARGVHSDAAFIFGLRMLAALRASGQLPLARRLATAMVDGYAAGLALDIGSLAVPAVLCAYGELLAELHASLDIGGEAWRKLLRPFDRAAYVEAARGDVSGRASSMEIHPHFSVPEIFRAHAETLVALASAVETFEEPLQAALELYETERREELSVEAFSWMSLARVTGLRGTPPCEALFVRIGGLFARVIGSPPWLDQFLAAKHEAHILGYVAAGLGPEHPLSRSVQPKLRTLINELLADPSGIALGHALELANVLQPAGMPRDSERLATRALQILENRSPHGHDPYSLVARALLAGALAQQELWPEILTFEPERNAIVLSAHARFVENIRALALLETGRPGEAEHVIRRVLEVEPANRVALVNLTALHLRAGDWQKAIDDARAATEKLLPGDDLDRVLLNEALAHEQLGDTFGAARLLDQLSGPAKTRADIAAARERLQRGSRTAVLAAPGVSSGSGGAEPAPQSPVESHDVAPSTRALPPMPADAVDVAVVTALKEEYEAVKARLGDCRDVPINLGHAYPNLYGWVLGTIPKADGSGTYRVVVAWAGCSGNLRTLITTTRTIDRWHPRYVLFSGIAGGLKKDALRQGDVVVSQSIWYYEQGKVSDGEFKPRHRDSFRVDGTLLSSARSFDSATAEWKQCGLPPPAFGPEPKLVLGMIGSGEKVIDDLEPAFVKAILESRPELQAIEMEAAGACVAIEHARDEGKQVGFLMIRGISDMPADATVAAPPAVTVGDATPNKPAALPPASGTIPRDTWKLYASAISAEFVAKWLASSWWPIQPGA
jgi:nucleoside phosphorylase/tetratricopeptide (TPR) repeat protein